MSSQSQIPPDLPAHADDFDDTTSTDQGVPGGDADVEADRENASRADDSTDEPSTEAFLAEGKQQMASDDGEAVGRADLEADRDNAGGAPAGPAN